MVTANLRAKAIILSEPKHPKQLRTIASARLGQGLKAARRQLLYVMAGLGMRPQLRSPEPVKAKP